MAAPLFIGRKKSVLAVTEAMEKDKRLFFSMQKDASIDVPVESDISILGTIGEITQLLKLPDGTVKALVKGISRAKIVDFIKRDDFFQVDTEIIEEEALSHAEGRVIKRAVIEAFKEYAEISDDISKEEVEKISAITDSSEILDAVAAKLPFRIKDKQRLLETTSVKKRLSQLRDMIIYVKDDESRKGKIIDGIVQRIERGDIIVNCGEVNGILPLRERVPTESYRRGDRIRAYTKGVLRDTSGARLILSRIHADFLVNLFKAEVPEISEGIVSIVAAAREPGVRAMIAVDSEDPDVDPVGACVGMKGSRVQNVVQELQGERVGIIPWHADHAKFIANALAPAEISRVIIDDKISKSMKVIVPNEFLSLAIGEQGLNARLASKLTGWHLDILSEEGYGI
jgi:transcription termination factor NusA